jgi:thioredoxin-related protein
VDRLEQDLQGQITVIRLDINTTVGRELGARWNFQVVPTFILFDGTGRELYRAFGALKPESITGALAIP